MPLLSGRWPCCRGSGRDFHACLTARADELSGLGRCGAVYGRAGQDAGRAAAGPGAPARPWRAVRGGEPRPDRHRPGGGRWPAGAGRCQLLLRPGAATSPQRLFRPVYGRGKGQAQMISGWPGSALEPGRTRIQHLDLDTRIVRLPARIDRIARRASRGRRARRSVVCDARRFRDRPPVARPIPCGLLDGGPMSPAVIRCALGNSGTTDH
jgi:hypothetical protein